MDLSLRHAIVGRIKDKSNEELYHVIEDSIGGDDKALPGLGVIFEIIWQSSDSTVQNKLVSTLKSHLT